MKDTVTTQPVQFEGLAEFRTDEVAVWNWCVAAGVPAGGWARRVRDAIAGLMERPAGRTMRLTAKHWLEASREPLVATFAEDGIVIGREPGCGLVVPEAVVQKEHARVFVKDGAVMLEDLGSRLGTFIGDRKLEPNQLVSIAPEVVFTIFPYSLQVSAEHLWIPEDRLEFLPARLSVGSWSDACSKLPVGSLGADVRLLPTDRTFSLILSRGLIDEALGGLLGQTRVDAPGLLETDAGCLDFLTSIVFDALNTGARWPWRFECGRWGGAPTWDANERGVLVEMEIRLRDHAGAAQLFLPFHALRELHAGNEALCRDALPDLAWTCRAVLAEVELAASEAATLAEGDTVLIEPKLALLLPGLRKGWHCASTDSNFSGLSIDKSLEMPEIERDQKLSVDELPVLFQVVLAEKVFTLSELRSLGAGSIVDLGRGDGDPVRLALNGKLLGSGELVRIEGQLGVRVLGWNQ